MAFIKRRSSDQPQGEDGQKQLDLDIQPESYESAPSAPEEEPSNPTIPEDLDSNDTTEEKKRVFLRPRKRTVRAVKAENTENTENVPAEENNFAPAEEKSEDQENPTADSAEASNGENSSFDQNQASGENRPVEGGQNPAEAGETSEGGYHRTYSREGYQRRSPWNNRRNNYNNNYNNGNQRGGYQNRRYNNRYNNAAREAARDAAVEAAQIIENPEEYESKPRLLINDLTKMSMPELRDMARQYGYPEEELPSMKKQDLIFVILKAHTEHGGIIFASGALEILPDGYGFLRSPQNSYLPGPDDIYISPSQIRLFNLKTGDTIYGQIRSPKQEERFFALLRIETVNFDEPRVAQTRVPFENLTPLYPQNKFTLETVSTEYSTRVVDLFAPIGKGQRLLIVAPPKAGKTILMQKIANAITANNPEVYLIVLLIDERPEEVTEMERSIKAEVISSTFDEQATRHVQVAEMVLEKAKRLVEHKRDVVIFLDSITRLARAYNQTVPTSGKVLSGGVDSNALHKPKRFFGAARNVEEGGSLTIISTALIETGSRMDEVIFEEFKGTGNSEIDLDRKLAERRLFPAINIKKSGTRKEELLLDEATLQKLWVLRKVISPMEDAEIMELILNQMHKSKNNDAFLAMMNTGSAAQ